jgi:hypothetical protein
MKNVAETFIRRRAERQLDDGKVVIFAAGTGNPVFLHRHHRRPARQRNGRRRHPQGHPGRRRLRFKDPRKIRTPNATSVTFHQCISQRLNVMDTTAFSLCMDNHIPIIVFDLAPPETSPTPSAASPSAPSCTASDPPPDFKSQISNLKPQKPWTPTKPSLKSKMR